MSAYLSMRFNRTPTPQATGILTPPKEVALEGDPLQTQVEESHPTQTNGIPHFSTESTAERMVEVVKAVMGSEQPTKGRETAMGEVVETFLADVATRACQVVAFAQTLTLDSVVKELKHVVSFMR